MNNQPIKKKEKQMVKKTVKKAEKKAKSSKVTLKSLQDENPVMVTGELLNKCIAILINNVGKAFTSYELAPMLAMNEDKPIRNSFRAIGLKKANIPENRGVVECPNNPDFAIVRGKVGARVSFKAVKLG